jgi:hypothetical protein
VTIYQITLRDREFSAKPTAYSVLTWNSTFHRRSELTCFIHSSSVPNSVTTELICTGTTCPAAKSGSGGRLISSRLVSSNSRSEQLS